MTDFAVWLKRQYATNDPELAALQQFAITNAPAWPYESNALDDYIAVLPQPIDAGHAQLLATLARKFERWHGQENAPHRGFWSQLVEFMMGHFGALFLGIFGIVLASVLVIGIFDNKFFGSLSKPEQARGLITFLFSISTIAVIMLIAIATFWMNKDEVQARFDKAKDLLTIIIGVLGTILGFYFGSLTSGDGARGMFLANVEQSSYVVSSGDKVTISASIVGGISPYRYNILFNDFTGVVATDRMTIKDKTSENAKISEPVPIPGEITKPTAVTYTILASDADGIQARAVGTIFVRPK
jgi:hypothetical protein